MAKKTPQPDAEKSKNKSAEADVLGADFGKKPNTSVAAHAAKVVEAATSKPRAKRPTSTATEPRRMQKPRYSSFKLQPRIQKPAGETIASAFKIFRKSVGTLKRNWKLFGGIILTYGVLNVLLVRGLSGSTNLNTLKSTIDGVLGGHTNSAVSGASTFIYMLGSSGTTTSSSSGSYQFMWILLVSLVLIWTLREVYAAHKVRIRDGFYRGMYPLIPFVLVLMVIALQLIPLIIGAFLYNTINANGVAASSIERLLWFSVMILAGLLSVYMISSSVFALYIVSLPDMTPMKALRSARQLVLYRRWAIVRKVLFLPFALIICGGIIMIPLILWAAPVATWVFFILTMIGLALLHSYMYALYRELL